MGVRLRGRYVKGGVGSVGGLGVVGVRAIVSEVGELVCDCVTADGREMCPPFGT
eukprot:NODE_12191_length_239_cov_4.010526_g10421_i0.p4 GENE.NODE_12191_length_239_cov_4.010526_g10421_i0~~NODE_12191_length_239_cov_4.010526_g10421_i0.p4  ORF type:complete len:62 (-),score=13.22 NODE_12191_length_239_cov_4.010526_g10421_i0:53-214(-)